MTTRIEEKKGHLDSVARGRGKARVWPKSDWGYDLIEIPYLRELELPLLDKVGSDIKYVEMNGTMVKLLD